MEASDQTTTRHLLYSISQGDANAFREFFDLHKNRIFNFVEKIVRSSSDAEEIVQDVFLKIWIMAPTLAAIDYSEQYIYTMARNRSLNFLRKLARDKNRLQQIWAATNLDDTRHEDWSAVTDLKNKIQHSLNKLSQQKQEIYRLSREIGLNHAEIAVKMELSESRVKNVITETLKFLRAELAIPAIVLGLLHLKL